MYYRKPKEPAKTLTDADILALVRSGELTMTDCNTREPRLYRNGKELKATICGTKGTRYRFEICKDGKKRTILRSTLTYMYVHRKLIPLDHELHHEDEDRYNDGITNLTLLHNDDHHAHHYHPTDY